MIGLQLSWGKRPLGGLRIAHSTFIEDICSRLVGASSTEQVNIKLGIRTQPFLQCLQCYKLEQTMVGTTRQQQRETKRIDGQPSALFVATSENVAGVRRDQYHCRVDGRQVKA